MLADGFEGHSLYLRWKHLPKFVSISLIAHLKMLPCVHPREAPEVCTRGKNRMLPFHNSIFQTKTLICRNINPARRIRKINSTPLQSLAGTETSVIRRGPLSLPTAITNNQSNQYANLSCSNRRFIKVANSPAVSGLLFCPLFCKCDNRLTLSLPYQARARTMVPVQAWMNWKGGGEDSHCDFCHYAADKESLWGERTERPINYSSIVSYSFLI